MSKESPSNERQGNAGIRLDLQQNQLEDRELQSGVGRRRKRWLLSTSTLLHQFPDNEVGPVSRFGRDGGRDDGRVILIDSEVDVSVPSAHDQVLRAVNRHRTIVVVNETLLTL